MASSAGQLEIAKARSSEYRKLYTHVGPERFAAGVDKAIHNHATGFFPTIPEFEPFVPAFSGERPKRCGICENTAGLVLEFKDQPNGSRRAVMVKCLHGQEIHRYDDYQERRVGQ